jgi:hypothetical protein
MSRKSRTEQAWDRTQDAASQLKPVAAQVKPIARTTGEAAKRGLHRTRVWAAPQVERSGQVLQETVAPKVAAALSAAAERIDPAKPKRHRVRNSIGIATLTAAASAAVAYLRNRNKPMFNAPNSTVDASPATSATTYSAADNGQPLTTPSPNLNN